MTVSLIVAMDCNQAIGKDGEIPWKIRDDMALFKMATYGHNVYMGRKTWESIGSKPLFNRKNWVFSDKLSEIEHDYRRTSDSDYTSLDILPRHELGHMLESIGEQYWSRKIVVIGGTKLYEEALPIADELLISRVMAEVQGADTFFPAVDWDEWEAVAALKFDQNDRNEYAFEHTMYRRVK